jgi:hypothetical protein
MLMATGAAVHAILQVRDHRTYRDIVKEMERSSSRPAAPRNRSGRLLAGAFFSSHKLFEERRGRGSPPVDDRAAATASCG